MTVDRKSPVPLYRQLYDLLRSRIVQGESILVALLERYLGGTESTLAQTLLAQRDTEVAIVIDPANLFTWNFSERMRDSLTSTDPAQQSSCPE